MPKLVGNTQTQKNTKIQNTKFFIQRRDLEIQHNGLYPKNAYVGNERFTLAKIDYSQNDTMPSHAQNERCICCH